jgi:hypothetical protein
VDVFLEIYLWEVDEEQQVAIVVEDVTDVVDGLAEEIAHGAWAVDVVQGGVEGIEVLDEVGGEGFDPGTGLGVFVAVVEGEGAKEGDADGAEVGGQVGDEVLYMG